MSNFFDPAILFFLLGIFAGLVRSNLEIPPQVARFLALYLLMALGLKGGFALAKTGLTLEVMEGLCAALFLATVIPFVGYQILKRLTSKFDAAAIAATYGSVSAVTFITTVQYLDTHGIAYSGHMAAAMALMESPAIIMAVLFASAARRTSTAGVASSNTSITHVLHESFTDGAQLLLLGAMLVGYVSGETGKAMMAPFSIDLFKGMLAFFLLDMGLSTARNLNHLKGTSPLLMAYGVMGPICHAGMAFVLSGWLGLSHGDTALLMVLAASASYIAVPAVVRYAIPEANASLYFGLSLGVTFPLNIIFGIPIYVDIASRL
ncbi:sodium-dependent bicarbonate transport family permease [Limnohabitans sp. MORI2]|uniref:sodium-dependent bicarbonate transport family permease n=1 Tax=Limnohabitans sp. MORI2 TaxID=1751150 RepID=UPI002492657B|nr:sodium-dependent bicarbonate transport family permease [Limnohabitans sp. MORI2]